MKNEELLPEKIRNYMKQHDLYNTVTRVLNETLIARPADPFGHLVEVFAQRAVVPPCFEAVRLSPQSDAYLLECVVKTRGMTIRPHESELPLELFELIPEPVEVEEGADPPEEPPVAYADPTTLGSVLSTAVSGCTFPDVHKLHRLVEKATHASKLRRPDDLVAVLVAHLYMAASNVSNQTPLEFFHALLESKQIPCSPQLRAAKWARWVFPLLTAGEGSPVQVPAMLGLALPLSLAAGETAVIKDEGLPALNALELLQAAADEVKANLLKGKTPEATEQALMTESLLASVKAAAAAAPEGSSGVLVVNAGAGRSDEGYTLEDAAMDSAALVDWYVQLLEASNGWLKVLVAPFAREDVAAYELLAERCPGLTLVNDLDGDEAHGVKTSACSFLATLHTASSLLDTYERVGEKFLPPTVVSVAAAAADCPATLECLLALGDPEYIITPRLGQMAIAFHELLAGL